MWPQVREFGWPSVEKATVVQGAFRYRFILVRRTTEVQFKHLSFNSYSLSFVCRSSLEDQEIGGK